MNPKYQSVTPDALNIAWLNWIEKLRKKREIQKPEFRTVWNEEVEDVLLLLLFLPSVTPKKTFAQSIGKFLIFHKVCNKF